MKELVGLWGGLLLSSCIPVFSQIDTTYIYNNNMPYGTLDIRIAKSDTRYYYLQEDITFSYRESAPGVKTNTFRDMTSWDSSPYREGNLREKNGNNDYFIMNYRFLLPKNYDAAYSPGYPIIIMFHGLGERGNCWSNDCYWSTRGWNPNTNNPPAPTSATHNLLNNDHNLLHGGLKHLDAVNLAGSKLPDDPTLPARAFPGILVFPQNLNGWGQTARVEDAIRLLRLMIRKYNVDENRVYVHGLSNGGAAVYQCIKRAPWLFAAALPMSAINDGSIVANGLAAEAGKIPLWVFQGGQDRNPTPGKTYNTIKALREAGANVRYYLYDHLGHGTWNTAYSEPDFFSWMLSQRKNNPHIYYGNPVICNTNGRGVRLSFSIGFPAYQWERDGAVITGADQPQYTANTPGTYRGRISRKLNPGPGDWESWSEPIVVTEISPAKPSVEVTGSTHLRGPGLSSTDANNTVVLRSVPEAELYTWYKDGVALNFPFTDVNDTLRTATFTSSGTSDNGAYTLVTSYSYCPSPPSDPVYLFFNNSAPRNITFNPATANFKGVVTSNGVFLSWSDQVDDELGYEIWRKKSGEAGFRFAGRTTKDAISFYDGPLAPETTYLYKIRAISKTGVSDYVPANDLDVNYEITTAGDATPPLPPQELKMTGNTIESISLSWKPAVDNAGIKEYIIRYGNTTVSTGSPETNFTLSNIPSNMVYPISVRAVDFAGHTSQPSNQIIASTYVLGLFYKHSTGAWTTLDDSTLKDTWQNPEFTGTINNFSLAPRTQEDFFNFQFTGYLDILTEGNYVFSVTSDDGSRLLIDDSVAVDNDGRHGSINVVGDTLHLTAGPHWLELQYFDYAGSQSLNVRYKGPDLAGTFTSIPDSLFRSGKYVPSSPPSAPSDLVARGSGMQQIDLSWQSGGSGETEIYRAPGADTTFIIVARTGASAYADATQLTPGKTYYYKVRRVTATGVSAFTTVVSATTGNDTVAPSIPGSLQLSNKTHTQVAFSWNASTDNVEVIGYEVFSDGQLVGTTPIPTFTVTDLMPNTAYSLTVKAMDANDNRSGASEALVITTNPSAVYYSSATGDINLPSTWKSNPDGTGSSPENFSANGHYFIISNRTQTGLGGSWNVSGAASKVIVPTGVTLTVDHAFTAQVDLEGTATLNLNHATVPDLQRISAKSTVNFNVPSSIPQKSYGNILLSGTGLKTFDADTTHIAGNLVVNDGVSFKGVPGNGTTLMLGGDLSLTGVTDAIAADNRIDLHFTSDTSHTISTADDLYFYRIAEGENAKVIVQHAATPVEIVLGSPGGGGLRLADGAVIDIGNNTLITGYASVINAQNEKGRIAVNGGDLKLTSSASATSNLYVDAVDHTIDTLLIDLSAPGKLVIGEPLTVSGAIAIRSGELNANDKITLLSTAERTASIAEIHKGSISGSLTVQHYLEPMGDSWRDISTPVNGVTIADWQNYFPVTGPFAGASTGPGLTSDPSLFISRGATLAGYPGAGSSNQAPVERGRGYTARISTSDPVTLAVSGNPFQGNISFALNSGSGGGTNNGWNLIGNPYASSIVWNNDSEAWIKSSINTTAVMRINKLINGEPVGQYVYFNPLLGEGLILAGQAFWVQAFSQSPSLTVTEKAKGTVLSPYPQADPSLSHLTVTLQKGALTDIAYLLFTGHGTDAFDNLYDVHKKQNEGMFSLSSIIGDGISAAINDLPDSFCSKVVTLNLQNTPPGNYSLRFGSLESLAGIGSVSLTDNFTGAVVTVNAVPYAFTITDEPNSYGASRFILTFEKNQLDVTTPQVHADDICSQNTALVTILHSQAGVEYVVLNANDELLSPAVEGGAETVTLELSKAMLDSGVNSIRVRAGFKGCASQLLTAEAEFTYTPSFSINVQEDISVCLGEQAMLQASGVPPGGSYRWFDENGSEIGSVQEGTLVTSPVLRETVFHVRGVTANGCETELNSIHVYADTLEIPLITLYNDTLYTQVAQVGAEYQWKESGVNIPGATAPFYKPLASGNYSVIVFSSGCSKESVRFEYVIDPLCQVDVDTPVLHAADACGDETIPIQIMNSQAGVVYTAVNDKNEIISMPQEGNGETIELRLSGSALDPGANHIRVRADLEGCVDRVLSSSVVLNNIVIPPPTIIVENNTLAVSVAGAYQWKKDGEIIQDATDSIYTPLTTGSYTVVVSQAHCSKESDPVEFLVTDTEGGYSGKFVLNTFPVPSNSRDLRISIQSSKPGNVLIHVIDITGRPVFRQRYTSDELRTGVPVEPRSGPLSDGIYCVIALQGKIEVRRRVVIKN